MRLLLILTLLASCGKTVVKHKTKVEQVEIAQEFEGIYYLSNGSILELIQSEEGKVIISLDLQDIIVSNDYAGDLGTMPKFSGKAYMLEGKVHYKLNLNYTSNHNLRKLGSNSRITGVKRTDLIVEKIDARLKVTLLIYNAAINANIEEVVYKTELEE